MGPRATEMHRSTGAVWASKLDLSGRLVVESSGQDLRVGRRGAFVEGNRRRYQGTNVGCGAAVGCSQGFRDDIASRLHLDTTAGGADWNFRQTGARRNLEQIELQCDRIANSMTNSCPARDKLAQPQAFYVALLCSAPFASTLSATAKLSAIYTPWVS